MTTIISAILVKYWIVLEDHKIEISSFLNYHEAKNTVKEKNCFKSVLNTSCADLFITNSPKSFQQHA